MFSVFKGKSLTTIDRQALCI